MPTIVRLVHKTLLDGRYHVYTSPDVQGLHVSMGTKAEAQREVIAVVDAIAKRRGWAMPEILFADEALEAA